jgi:hypothetical protein
VRGLSFGFDKEIPMKPSELASVLPALIESRQPVMVWGPPGIGKSQIIRQVAVGMRSLREELAEAAAKRKTPANAAARMGRKIVDVRCVLLDPVDLRGIPHVNGDGKAHWAPPAFLPSDPDSDDILFMDELPQAAPLVQSSCLQLTLDRAIGEYALPEKCAIVAAGNRQGDRAGAHRLITPLLNRFVHLSVEVSVADWRGWAMANGIDSRVLSFIAFKPEALHQFDPKSKDESFATPRSWEFVSKVLPNAPTALRFALVKGCVGESAAAEFVTFCDLWGKLPDIDKVLADPTGHSIPSEPSVLYALIGALTERLRTSPAQAQSYVQYVTRMTPEYAVLAMRDGIGAAGVALIRTPEGSAWARANADILTPSKSTD